MSVKVSLQWVLALGFLVPLCSVSMAAQASILSEASSSAQFAWLLGAAVLGFSVVARRSPSSPEESNPAPKAESVAEGSENWTVAG